MADPKTPAAPAAPKSYVTPLNGLLITPLGIPGVDEALGHILDFTLAWETNGDTAGGAPHTRKGDPGGFTKFGISQRYNPDINVKNLNLHGAAKIYKQRYWDKLDIPKIQDNLAKAVLFDYAMNTTRGAVESAQALVGSDVTGNMDPETIKQINRYITHYGAENFARKLNESRRARIKAKSPKWAQKGLLNRVDDLEAYLVSRPFSTRALANMPDEAFAQNLLDSPAGTFSNRSIEALTPPTQTAQAKPITQLPRRRGQTARERAAQERTERERLGEAMLQLYGGRTAEREIREAPTEHPAEIQRGEAAQHGAQIGPTEQFLFGGPTREPVVNTEAEQARSKAKTGAKTRTLEDWEITALTDPAIQAWFKQLTGGRGDILENMRDPRGHYDYKAAIESGARPVLQPDGTYHWTSEYKLPGHPTYELKFQR